MDNDKQNTHLAFRSLIYKIIRSDRLKANDAQLDIKKLVESEELLFILKNLNGFILFCNYKTALYDYISDGIVPNLGYQPHELTGADGVNFLFSLIDPEHAALFVNTVMNDVLSYLSKNATRETGKDFRFTVCLKIKNIQQVYKWFLLDTVIVQTDEQGLPTITMITCTCIDSIKKDELLYYNIIRKRDDQLNEVVFENYANKNNFDILTPRETEILTLISQGYTNQKISAMLFISVDTVKAHRKSILKKTDCKGSVELLNFAFSRGLI